MNFRLFFFVLSVILLSSCRINKSISSIENRSQKVDNSTIVKDKFLDSFIGNYRVILDKKMNDTIAFNPQELRKEKVESPLGNWVGDAMKWYVDSVLHKSSDVAFCNYGGLRVKSIPQGTIQLKHIFELMPFENMLTIVEIDSVEMKVFLKIVAEKDGWPVSKGFKASMSSDHKIKSWSINGQNHNRMYKIILSDYVATGGDNMDLLIPKKKDELNILIRDALIAYARHQKVLSAKEEGRFTKEKKQDADK